VRPSLGESGEEKKSLEALALLWLEC
jgi:hypothetical protein